MNRATVSGMAGVLVGAVVGSLSTAHVFRSAYGSPADQQAQQFSLVATSIGPESGLPPSDLVKSRTLDLLSMQMVLVAPYFESISQPNLKAKVLRIASDEQVSRSLVGQDSKTAAACIANYRKTPVRECLQARLTPVDRG